MAELRLMTWNVRYFGHGSKGLRSSLAWMRRVAGGLADLSPMPDVIALQEVEATSLRAGLAQLQLARFLEELHGALEERGERIRFAAEYFPAHRYAAGTGPALYTTGLAVLTRVDRVVVRETATREVTHVRLKRLSALKQRRIVAHLRLRRRGSSDDLDLFNTHLSLPGFLEVGPHRIPERMGHGTNQLQEANRVLEFIDDRAGDRAILVGDFNAAPGSPVHSHLLTSGLVDAYAIATGRSADDWPTARFGSRRMHIDHVFSSRDVDWLGFEPWAIGRGPLSGLSDHAPKLGALEL